MNDSIGLKPRSNGAGRTLALGLDSADLKLIEKWASEGLLPFFATLLAHCALVRLTAVSRVLQGSIWPSIMTGLTPGHHGQYCFSQLERGSYALHKRHAANIAGERFYMRLGAYRVRCAFVDVPTDFLHPDFPGIQVVDWGAEFQYSTFGTHPPELKDEIESRFGKHLFTDYGKTGNSVGEHRKLRGELETGIRVKSAFTRQLLGRDDLDLIVVVYGEPHKAGHVFWKYMDPQHPDHVTGVSDMHDAMLSHYQLLDKELAALADELSGDDNLIVFADHGMQANYRGEHFMDLILERLGLCESARRARFYGGMSEAGAVREARRKVRRALHGLVRRVASADITNRLRGRFGTAARMNWSRTRAIALPTDRNSYLRINVRGREPQGVVEPGTEYDATLDMIEREFRALVNGETGSPAVEEVFRVQQLYPGPKAVDLPDVAVLWSSDGPINVLESPTIGRLETHKVERRSGNHRPEGFILARGPAFRPGRREMSGDILQIAPTLLALYGVPRPETYEMGPLTELLAAGTLAKKRR